MSVPFFMIIIEIMLYISIIIFIITDIYLITYYVGYYLSKRKVFISYYMLLAHGLANIFFIIFYIFSIMNIFMPEYFGKDISNEYTLIRISEFNIIGFVFSLVYFLISAFTSHYCGMYYNKNNKINYFGNYNKDKHIKKQKEVKFLAIIHYRYHIELFIKRSKFYSYFTLIIEQEHNQNIVLNEN